MKKEKKKQYRAPKIIQEKKLKIYNYRRKNSFVEENLFLAARGKEL